MGPAGLGGRAGRGRREAGGTAAGSRSLRGCAPPRLRSAPGRGQQMGAWGAQDAGAGQGALPGRCLPGLGLLALLQLLHAAGPVPGGNHVEAAPGGAGGRAGLTGLAPGLQALLPAGVRARRPRLAGAGCTTVGRVCRRCPPEWAARPPPQPTRGVLDPSLRPLLARALFNRRFKPQREGRFNRRKLSPTCVCFEELPVCMALLATSGLVLFLIMFWKGQAEPTKQSRFALRVPVSDLVHLHFQM